MQPANLTTAWIMLMTVWGIAVAISLWVMYRVIKAAVKDGIKESGLIEAVRRNGPKAKETENLPDWAK